MASNYIAPPTFLYQALVTTGTADSFDPSVHPPADHYDPTQGDLIIVIIASNQDNIPNGSGKRPLWKADDTGTVTSRAYCITGQDCVADSIGLTGSFLTTSTATPEPANTGTRRRRTIGSWTFTASCKSLIDYHRRGKMVVRRPPFLFCVPSMFAPKPKATVEIRYIQGDTDGGHHRGRSHLSGKR